MPDDQTTKRPRRVLFVDDEPLVLSAVRRNLRGMTQQGWDLHFVESGAAALAMLAEMPFDAVVSDMRMPGMDGAELLAHVRRDHPSAIRLVLSGYGEQEMTVKLVNAAHQYLTKPCDPAELRTTLERAVALRRFLRDEGLATLVTRVHRLPSPPLVYQRVSEQLADPMCTLEKIALTMSCDPAMTAKILQLVNSSFFGMSRRVSDVQQAVGLLGLNFVNALILTVHIFAELPARPTGLRDLWRHSFRTGRLAREIMRARMPDPRSLGEAFSAGVLHDVGKLMLATELPMPYGSMVAEAVTHRTPCHEIERQQLGASHAELGGYLLGLWNLPDPVVEAVAYHHRPGDCEHTGFSALTAVHIADTIDRRRSQLTSPRGPLPELDRAYLAAVDVTEAELAAWETLGDGDAEAEGLAA